MCNRYVLASGISGIEKELLAEFRVPYIPFYNAYPGGSWPVVLSESPAFISYANWGLVPYWSKWHSGNYNYNTFVTDIVKHPVYRVPVRNRRCLVPANCFFVWVKRDGVRKPYLVYIKDQRVFTFAGVYDVWKDKSTNVLHYSFAIISTFSCKRLSRFVSAMPVIIPPSRRSKYLKGGIHLNEVMQMLMPFEHDALNLYPVSNLVNDPFINDKRIVQPIGERVYKDVIYKQSTHEFFGRK